VLDPTQALEGSGDAVGESDAIVDQRAPSLDQAAQRAHGRALGLERAELVRMTKQQLQGDFCVGRIVLGATGGECIAVAGERRRLYGEQHEEVVLKQRGDDWAAGQLEADRNRCALEALAELLRPLANGRRAMLQDGALALVRAGGSESHVVLAVCPVDADERCELFLHGASILLQGELHDIEGALPKSIDQVRHGKRGDFVATLIDWRSRKILNLYAVKVSYFGLQTWGGSCGEPPLTLEECVWFP